MLPPATEPEFGVTEVMFGVSLCANENEGVETETGPLLPRWMTKPEFAASE